MATKKAASRSNTNRMKSGSEIEAIRDDLANLKRDIRSLVSDLADEGKHISESGADKLNDTAKAAGDQLQSMKDEACDSIRSNPIASVCIAAGVGAIAARLFWSER